MSFAIVSQVHVQHCWWLPSARETDRSLTYLTQNSIRFNQDFSQIKLNKRTLPSSRGTLVEYQQRDKCNTTDKTQQHRLSHCRNGKLNMADTSWKRLSFSLLCLLLFFCDDNQSSLHSTTRSRSLSLSHTILVIALQKEHLKICPSAAFSILAKQDGGFLSNNSHRIGSFLVKIPAVSVAHFMTHQNGSKRWRSALCCTFSQCMLQKHVLISRIKLFRRRCPHFQYFV